VQVVVVVEATVLEDLVVQVAEELAVEQPAMQCQEQLILAVEVVAVQTGQTYEEMELQVDLEL
jgi:hypothetical protein